MRLSSTFNELVRSARQAAGLDPPSRRSVVELLIVDEADRLKVPELEEIRDRSDRANVRDGVSVVLIGLPGIEKRLARYPQRVSRVGFVHRCRPLSEAELRFILAHKWQEVGLRFSPDDWTDAEALAAIARITGATSAWCSACSRRSSGCWRSTRCGRSRPTQVNRRESLVIGPLT